MSGFAVWWTDQKDCDAITPETGPTIIGPELAKCPKYIQDQYCLKYGRNGRGGIWSIFENSNIDPWPDTDLSKLLVERYAGIVIFDSDVEHVKQMPGIVTNMKLERI